MNDASNSQRSTRSCKKLIRFTPSELEQVNARARAAQQPVACYIRDVSLGARKRAVGSTPMSQMMVHRLSRVATRLCTLREIADRVGLAEAHEFGAALADVLDLIRDIE